MRLMKEKGRDRTLNRALSWLPLKPSNDNPETAVSHHPKYRIHPIYFFIVESIELFKAIQQN